MVNQCVVCGACIKELYRYCLYCSKQADVLINCQAIMDSNILCTNKASMDELFCIYHKKTCIYCRRADAVYCNRCKDCMVDISLNNFFK